MMWLASELALFAQVADLGSFTAVGRALGVPKVAVSRALRSLEQRTGTPLLTRTTRRVALTEAGVALLPCARRIAAETAQARALLPPAPGRPQPLRVVADAAYGRVLLAPLLPRFMEKFPHLPLEVAWQGPGEIAGPDPWDLQVRIGPPTEEGLIAQLLGSPPLILCATPAYLRAHGSPKTPAELARHAVLVPIQPCRGLRLSHGARHAEVPLEPRLAVSDPTVVHAATAAGSGIGLLPEFLCRQGLAMKRLERVLPDWQAGELLQIYAVGPLARATAPGVRELGAFLAAHMLTALGGG